MSRVADRLWNSGGWGLENHMQTKSWFDVALVKHLLPPFMKLDDGWPESEKGDVTAAVNMLITR